MAQISIPMSNKVGYSMFWNSMWDRKINFARSIKEDLYLNIFIPLIFQDKVSSKLIKTLDLKKLTKSADFIRYNLHVKLDDLKKPTFYKYMTDLNKIKYFSSKVWILKYQKWIIIYFFIYMPKFNSIKNNNYKLINQKNSYININDLFVFYKNSMLKTKYSYNFFNKKFDKFYF